MENLRLNFGVDFGNECIILGFWFVEFIKSVHISEFSSKEMIQIFVFWNYFLLRIKILESPNQKTKLDTGRMFIFILFYLSVFLPFSFWPIKSANLQNSGVQSKIWTGWQFDKYLISQFFYGARSKLKNSKSIQYRGNFSLKIKVSSTGENRKNKKHEKLKVAEKVHPMSLRA